MIAGALFEPPLALARAGEPPATDGVFLEQAQTAGLTFVHDNGARGELRFPEIVGSGAGLFDYDRDGDLDVYLVQGAAPATGRLYRNALAPAGASGTRALAFRDVTGESRLLAGGAGMGVAAGDYDRDGWTDLYITKLGSNELWRNESDGTFSNRTAAAGVDDPRWSVPAVFFDYDRDGWLDLWVGNYTDYRLASHKRCVSAAGTPDYCAPQSYGTETSRLLRNRGDGSFVETTHEAGISEASSYMLGAVPLDFDGDGWLDLYVANDGLPNFLWINRRDGTFREEGLLYGCAVNDEGDPEASMGVDAGDFDGDGDLDLFMTHLDGETNTLYRNDEGAGCTDVTDSSGLGPPSFAFTGFGTAWLDYDNDGRLDLLTVNGAVRALPALVERGDPRPYHQRPQLFHNEGGGRFADRSATGGPYFSVSEVGRGAAFGDLDNDGDTDVVVSTNGGPARLLVNQIGQDRAWIGLELLDASGRVTALAARAGVFPAAGSPALWRVSRAAGSYASANDPRLLYGLGDHQGPAVERVEVWWPDGSREEWRGVATRRYTQLVKGKGTPLTGSSE